MSSEWLPSTVGQFCPFKYGKNLPERDRQKGCVPVVSSAGIVGKHNSAHVESGGVVVGRKGTVGSVTLLEEPFWPIDTAFYVEDLPEVRNLRFTYYLLRTLGLEKMNTDSAVPGLNRDNAHALRISVPKLKHQREIAESLQALDDRISLLRDTNATLEAIAQALFKSWFVDFDPVRAKLEGRTPEGMDEATAALFPDGFEESELGMVPRGWRVSSMSQVCKISSGNRPGLRSDSANENAPIPLFGGAGIMGFTNEALFSVRKILTGRVGTLGKVHIAYPPFWASDNVLVLAPEDSRSFHFCFHWLNSIDVHALNRGSTQPLLTQKDLGKQEHIFPTDFVLDAFGAIAGVIYGKIRSNELQAQTLATLRDTLLPRLISGQLRLPEVS